MGKRVIFHVDVNSAYLSWEAEHRLKRWGGSLDLRTVPSAVGGDVRLRHGIILAKSIPAGRYGVRTGETLGEARRKCPGLVLVPPNYGLYGKASAAMQSLLREYTPDVEVYSIDECFMDVTGAGGLWGEPKALAEQIRGRIREELGFTVNIGVASNKVLAKMASDFRKPDRVHTLWEEEIEEKLWPLPVNRLFFAGPASVSKLNALGISTIGQLAKTDPRTLALHMKSQGEVLWAFANGLDCSAVEPEAPPNKGYGNSMTTPYDLTEAKEAHLVLLSLAETVGSRIRRDGVKIGVVSVAVRDWGFSHGSRQMTLSERTDSTREIHEISCRLFDELWDGTPLRHLGIHTGQAATVDARQRGLFDEENREKWEKLDRAVDQVRRKYGEDALMRASFLHTPFDHMAGGVSREKRSVDYENVWIG